MTPDSIRILIVDDHAIVRKGIHVLLSKEQGMQVVGEASNGAGLAIGGSGVRLTVHTRCAYCMAPIKPGWTACGNCGRETR